MPTYTLTIPSGTNNLYATIAGKARVKESAYRKWIKVGLMELMAQRARQVATPVHVSLYLPTSSRLDIDAPIKPTLDLLVRAAIIPDDKQRYVHSISATWQDGISEMRVMVESVGA